jgi:peptidoglycan hydrolase-like protein with peptidoglycan-binding domain
VRNGLGSPGSETNYFGTLTRNALAHFQAAHGINPPAGYFGPITRAFITNTAITMSTSNASSSQATSTLPVAPPTVATTPNNPISPRDLTIGRTGPDVYALQQLLIELNSGGAAQTLARVGPTNYFGRYTQNALAEYQLAHGINPAVGYFGTRTRVQMKSAGVAGLWW